MQTTIMSNLLSKISGLHEIPKGAYSIRKNGKTISLNSTEHIIITPKEDKEGLDFYISGECQKESLHIPVVIEDEDIQETVYNTFNIGGGADVTIVAGCGVHNDGEGRSQHDGIHELFVGKWANVKYVENHYASGNTKSQKVLNPQTIIHVGKDAVVTLELTQLGGVNKTKRNTMVYLEENAKLIISERLLTEDDQQAYSNIKIEMNGENSSAQILSRSVAKQSSMQDFTFELIGNNKSKGHIECNAIVMDKASVISKPITAAFCAEANLIHESAIGKLESKQLTKLMTLGVSEKDAEEIIINGFLK